MYQKIFAWIQKYERHLSALAMVAGFIVDNIFFERVDLWQTQIVFAGYTATCFISIPVLHWIEARTARGRHRPRWRVLFPLATQFALGGFWSGFVIFYGRSADLGASWPFLIFLFLILLGSEYFSKYHERLVFTSILFFFALYSYAIFALPIYIGTIGVWTFIESGIVALCIFALFTVLLRVLARERFIADIQHIRLGALGVFVVLNIFYFTNILPPLPLSASAAGVYHSVVRISDEYQAEGEKEPWQVRYLGFAPVLHVLQGETLSVYSSVFAPTALTTNVVHRWQWYDPINGKWLTKAIVAYPIVGGRDNGYRGYSTVGINEMGKWRVDVETIDGRRITRLSFTTEVVTTSPSEETLTLY
jgi:hypothetical protein